MTLRFHIFLLSVASLVLLNACGTTAPATVEKPVLIVEQPSEPEISESDVFDLQTLMQKHPADLSLAETIELSRQMTTYQADIALQVLRSLESIPSAQLAVMIEGQTYDPEFTEWLELALQSRRVLIGQTSTGSAARKWANFHYGHAIAEADFADLMTSYGRLYPVPARVAVLLPTEGGLSSAARAIRDGIMSAYLEQPGNTVLRFYSSGSDSETAIAAYLQAREDGATQIIGPLRSSSAGALASLNDPSVPILLLNQPNESSADPIQESIIKSLSLLQNEEAMAIAEKALAQGQKRVIVIAADSPWGRRMEDAFISRFEAGEGQVAASTRFSSVSEEYSAMLTRLLKIDESKQRKADLQSWLGTRLNFEPSQRDEGDDEQHQDMSLCPAVLSLFQRDHECTDGDRERRSPRPVELRLTTREGQPQPEVRHDAGQQAERHIDEEDPWPGEVVDDEPAEEWADQSGSDEGEGEVADVLAAFARRENVAEDGECESLDRSAAETLDGTERDELAHRLREPAQQRPEDKQAERRLEHEVAPIQIGQLAQQRRTDRRGDDVGGAHPREVLERLELADDRRQRRRDDRDLHRRKEDGEHERAEHQPQLPAREPRDTRNGHSQTVCPWSAPASVELVATA